MGRASPKSKEDELFGSRTPAGKPKSGGNLDDIFGKRRSPTDQDLFSGKKTPTNGRQSPKGTDPLGRKTPTQKDDPFSRRTPTQREDATGRKTPTQKDDSFGRKSPGQKEDPFGRKTTTNSGPSLDDIFGGIKRAESPLFKGCHKTHLPLPLAEVVDIKASDASQNSEVLRRQHRKGQELVPGKALIWQVC